MTVGSGQFAKGMPRPSQIRWRLLPRLALSVGFGPVSSPPKIQGTEQLSITARDQSMWPSRESQSRNAKWTKPQIPSLLSVAQPPPAGHAGAATQFFGSIRQGMPLRSTKIMPVRQARSVRRGRPPCALGKGFGRSGSIQPPQRIRNKHGSHVKIPQEQ